MAKHIVDVLVPVALDQAYSYRVPAGLELAPGDLVRVPLGPREATGAVWGQGVARPGLDNRLKEVAEKLLNLTGCNQPINYAPRSSATLVRNRIGDPRRAAAEIGFKAQIPLDEGLSRHRRLHGAASCEVRRTSLGAGRDIHVDIVAVRPFLPKLGIMVALAVVVERKIDRQAAARCPSDDGNGG